jgi:hypothetical protein
MPPDRAPAVEPWLNLEQRASRVLPRGRVPAFGRRGVDHRPEHSCGLGNHLIRTCQSHHGET